MSNTATRLFNLILLLQRRPNRSASELAEALDVSVRTIQRYIVMLEEIGVPVYAERGARGGYSLVRGYRMPPLILSPEEAVAVHLGTSLVESVWGKLFRHSSLSALTKIEDVLPKEQLQEIAWARSSLITRGLPSIDPHLDTSQLDILYQAVRQGRQVNILYQGKQQKQASWRRINPYVLIYSWGRHYCVAYCQHREAMRSFRLDRIQGIERLETRFTKPADFDPGQYLDEALDARALEEVRLYFPPETARLAHDYRCCWDSFEERPDGSVVAGFHSADLDTATQRVMGILDQARILGPEALKTKVAQAARAIVEQYREQAAITESV